MDSLVVGSLLNWDRKVKDSKSVPIGLKDGNLRKASSGALLLPLAFVVVEALAGVYANSLALLTDAVHNLTDVIALALSWYALRLTARPAHAGKTFGYHRSGILVALGNSTPLALISLWIFYEAYQRLLAPPAVDENILVAVAAVAFFINSGTAWMVHRGGGHALKLRI